MEFIPKFIQSIHERYNIDDSKLNALWTGISSEKLYSTYRIFWKQQYTRLKTENPDIILSQAMKQISVLWKQLSVQEKQKIYQDYISKFTVKYLPKDLSEDDAHEYFESKNVDYLRKMVTSFYEGDESIEEWSKEKCISFLVAFNET